MVALLEFYDEDVVKEGDTRVVVRFPFDLAPIKYAILPLMDKDDAMVSKAEELFHRLRKTYSCEFDLGGNIGKRYRRQDEIGTPYCVTIDHQTLEDGTVTVRDRDTMQQVRVKMDEVGLKK
jgi:glycyl-tRNA synthetase